MSDSKKKYNLRIAPMRKSAAGFVSRVVDDEMFDALQTVEKGGRLFLKLMEGKDDEGNPTPYAYLEYASKEDVQAFASKLKAGKAPSAASDSI